MFKNKLEDYISHFIIIICVPHQSLFDFCHTSMIKTLMEEKSF